jgi:hypothetical protein
MIAKILAGAFALAFVVMVITFIYTCIVFYRRKKKTGLSKWRVDGIGLSKRKPKPPIEEFEKHYHQQK